MATDPLIRGRSPRYIACQASMDWGDAVPTHTTHAETQMYTRPWFGNVVKSLTLHTARCTRGTPLKTTPPLSGGGDYSFRGCEGLWMETDTASVSPFLRVQRMRLTVYTMDSSSRFFSRSLREVRAQGSFTGLALAQVKIGHRNGVEQTLPSSRETQENLFTLHSILASSRRPVCFRRRSKSGCWCGWSPCK